MKNDWVCFWFTRCPPLVDSPRAWGPCPYNAGKGSDVLSQHLSCLKEAFQWQTQSVLWLIYCTSGRFPGSTLYFNRVMCVLFNLCIHMCMQLFLICTHQRVHAHAIMLVKGLTCSDVCVMLSQLVCVVACGWYYTSGAVCSTLHFNCVMCVCLTCAFTAVLNYIAVLRRTGCMIEAISYCTKNREWLPIIMLHMHASL